MHTDMQARVCMHVVRLRVMHWRSGTCVQIPRRGLVIDVFAPSRPPSSDFFCLCVVCVCVCVCVCVRV